jgi:hypothetical protein
MDAHRAAAAEGLASDGIATLGSRTYSDPEQAFVRGMHPTCFFGKIVSSPILQQEVDSSFMSVAVTAKDLIPQIRSLLFSEFRLAVLGSNDG